MDENLNKILLDNQDTIQAIDDSINRQGSFSSTDYISDLDTGKITDNIQKESDSHTKNLPIIEIKDYLKFLNKPFVQTVGNEVNFFISFSLSQDILKDTSFYIRFGSYDDIPENWEDLKIVPSEIAKNDQGNYTIHKTWVIPYKGNFGATIYATYPTSSTPLWQGTKNDDAKFRIDNDCFFTIEKIIKRREDYKKGAKNIILNEGMKSFSSFKDALYALTENPNSKYLSEAIYEATHTDPISRNKISSYYKQIKNEYEKSKDYYSINFSKNIAENLNHLGIREVALVAPEGPHATAGGLSQVMNGLLKALSNKKISVTLISPIYEFDQGSKHPCAEYLLKTGIKLGNNIFKPKYSGEVCIPFGKTSKQGAFHATATVHIAKKDNIKLVFLKSRRFADYLYARINPDEQLRRAIFLSRGALEVINNPIFDVNPQVIISNDWITGLIPAFLKLDERYSSSLAFKDCKTIHIIHNCGKDYHGNIPVNYHGDNLYGMLELDSKHLEGLTHPQNKGMLNLTASAIFHLNGATLTVSKPYAQELLDWNKGEGLTNLIKSRPGALFGISNGIDQISIRRHVISLGTNDFEDTISPEDDQAYFSKIPTYKARIKEKLQKNLGLSVNPNAKMFCFVGRFAEQKGIELLYNRPAGKNLSVIEEILCTYPDSQFIFAGPFTEGDTHARNFKSCVDYLSSKYPDRIKGIFNFVSHDYAIEIQAGSDFLLMPSRFEPGGLSQLEAIACGTIVIGRNVGGISCTLRAYGDLSDESNAFMFDTYTADALFQTICFALNETKDEKLFKTLSLQAAKARHDWNYRVESYIALFQYITGVLNPFEQYDFLDQKNEIIKKDLAY